MKPNIWRPQKYTKKSFDGVLKEYLAEKKSEGGDRIVTVLDFCIFAGITREYLSDHNSLEKSGTSQDFSDTIKRLKIEAEASMEMWALKGKINIPMAIFCLKNNHGWTDGRGWVGDDGGMNNVIFSINLPPSQFSKPELVPPHLNTNNPYSRM